MPILWNYVGAVTQNSAKAVAKAGYSYATSAPQTKVFALTYNGTLMRLYVDGVLVDEATNIAAGLATFQTLYFGADYDDTCWFKGLMPEIIFYNQALNDTDRSAIENFMKYKWGSGPQVPEPLITSGAQFLRFNETSLVKDVNGRVTSWNDLAAGRSMTLKAGTTAGVEAVNGRDALYFDNRTFFTLPPLAGAANNPDFMTLVFVARFDSFDTSPYPDGDASQSLISSTSNTQIRVKKFDSENYLGYRVRDWDGRTYYLDAPKESIVSTGLPLETIGTISLDFNGSTYSKQVDNLNDFGVARFDLSGLAPNTQYSGVFKFNGVEQPDTTFQFKTMPIGATSFKVIAGSCNRTGSNADTFDKILEENPDLFIHLGDLNYLDLNSTNKQDYSEALDISFTPKIKQVIQNIPFVYQFDNHDSLKPTVNKDDAAWTPFMEFFTGVHAYHTPGSSNPTQEGLYYSFTVGRAKFIVLDLRRPRDSQFIADDANKSMLGAPQKAWLKQELLNAKNSLNIEGVFIVSQVLWTEDVNDPNGFSYQSSTPAWGAYSTERAELANFIYSNEIKNVAFICADTHMQAIDDGRNSCYITDALGNRLAPEDVDKKYWTPVLEASPFDQYIAFEGGPFNINNATNSGGPYGSSEQSYGVIEVNDIGENWLQIKMYTKAKFGTDWVVNRSLTFNWQADTGTEGTPPLIPGENPPLRVEKTQVAVDLDWAKILAKWIEVEGAWKKQKHSWVGKDGYWILSHSDTPIDYSGEFVLRRLDGYSLEPENANFMRGDGILDYQYPSPKFGSYYELSKNYSDIFDNFSAGTVMHAEFDTVGGQPALLMTSASGYFMPSTDWDGFGLFGETGADKDFIIGISFYLNALPAAGNLFPLFSVGGPASGYILGVNSAGKIQQEVWAYSTPNTITSAGSLALGWNSIAVQRRNNVITIYTGSEEVNATAGIPPHAISDKLYFGTVWEVENDIKYYYAQPGAAYKNIYISSIPLDNENIVKLLNRQNPVVILQNTTTLQETQIPSEWMLSIRNDYVAYTLPSGFAPGLYNNFIRFSTGAESAKFPVRVTEPQKRTTPFTDDFSDRRTLQNNYYMLNRQWGGANGGVVAENAYLNKGELVLRAHGDRYSGSVQGVDRDGKPKFHTHPEDPQLGLPWTNRVGACVVFKDKTGFGRYEIVAKIPNQLGVCYAMWTFFYNEIYPGDPRWDDFQADGLHQQGTVEDGFYITRNHEIDIEFPSHLDGGQYNNPSLSNMKCNTWRGELQNWDVPRTDPAYWEEYRDNLTPVGFNIADGNYHRLRFDWHADRVEFYIDGVLKQVNTNGPGSKTIPDIPGHFTFGLWFPSAARADKPWLVRPDRAWAGGTIDPVDGGMKADFDQVEMRVRSFSFTPFDEPGENVTGETYPFGGYRVKN